MPVDRTAARCGDDPQGQNRDCDLGELNGGATARLQVAVSASTTEPEAAALAAVTSRTTASDGQLLIDLDGAGDGQPVRINREMGLDGGG